MKRLNLLCAVTAALLVTGCTTTRISQFDRFAEAGKTYSDAMVALTDEAGKVAVDANSEFLTSIRDDLQSENQRREEYEKHTQSVQELITELNSLREHSLLLRRYFAALADLARAKDETSAAANDLAKKLQDLHPRLKAAKIGNASVSEFVGEAAPLVVGSFKQRALERELRNNASLLERELELQKAFLEALSEGLRDDLETIARIRGADEVAKPYIREARLPSSWRKDRQQVLMTSLASASAENAAEAAKKLKETFVALVERRVSPGDFDMLFADIESMIDLIELVSRVTEEKED